MEKVIIALEAPVSPDKIERWVQDQVDRLRGGACAVGVRLGRLVPARGAWDADWLLEVERERGGRPEDDIALASVLTDMELLGLRPHLLVCSLPDEPELAPAHGGNDAGARGPERPPRRAEPAPALAFGEGNELG